MVKTRKNTKSLKLKGGRNIETTIRKRYDDFSVGITIPLGIFGILATTYRILKGLSYYPTKYAIKRFMNIYNNKITVKIEYLNGNVKTADIKLMYSQFLYFDEKTQKQYHYDTDYFTNKNDQGEKFMEIYPKNNTIILKEYNNDRNGLLKNKITYYKSDIINFEIVKIVNDEKIVENNQFYFILNDKNNELILTRTFCNDNTCIDDYSYVYVVKKINNEQNSVSGGKKIKSKTTKNKKMSKRQKSN